MSGGQEELLHFRHLVKLSSMSERTVENPPFAETANPQHPVTVFDVGDAFCYFLPTGPYSRDKLRILLSLAPQRPRFAGHKKNIVAALNDYGMAVMDLGLGGCINTPGLWSKPGTRCML